MASATAYPSAIARACAAIDEAPVFRDLPDGYIRVVVRIIKKIRLSCLKSPIYASRSTIAQESGKSVETVGRVVKWLEERNLIEREQIARRGLKGSSSPIRPTDRLLEALTLRQQPTSPLDTTVSHVTPEDEVIHSPEGPSPVRADGSKSTHQKQSKEIHPASPAPFVKIEGCALPTELTWLVTRNALKATGVLSLMKLASSKKQRLSDVVQASRKYLEGLTDRGLFAYLRKLVMQDRDYRAVVQQDVQAQADVQMKARVASKSVELEGRAYRTRDGKIQVFVRPNGFLEEVGADRRGFRPMDGRFLTAIDEGRLVPFVPA